MAKKQLRADLSRPASEEDWKVVLALEWDEALRKILMQMKEAGPEGLTLEAASYRGNLWSRYQAINNVLRKAAPGFRVGAANSERNQPFSKERWYLFHARNAAGA